MVPRSAYLEQQKTIHAEFVFPFSILQRHESNEFVDECFLDETTVDHPFTLGIQEQGLDQAKTEASVYAHQCKVRISWYMMAMTMIDDGDDDGDVDDDDDDDGDGHD